MDEKKEFYAGAMYGFIDAVKSKALDGSDRRYSENASPLEDSVAKALITTGHDSLVNLLLNGEPSNVTVTEVLYGYYRTGQLDKVVATLKKYPNSNVGFLITDLIKALIGSEASDQLILDLADYATVKDHRNSNRPGIYELRVLAKELWKKGRNDLAKKIMETCFEEKERQLMFILERVSKNEQVEPKEITELIGNYYPASGHMSSYEKTALFGAFLHSLEEYSASIDLLKATLEACKKLEKANQIDYISDTFSIARKIRRDLINRGDFDEAEKFARETEFGSWGEEEVLLARIAHAIKTGDKQTHQRLLERHIQIKDSGIKRVLKNAEKEKERENRGDTDMRWKARVERLQLEAEQDTERAIFELTHGTPESAQVCVTKMINAVEEIAVPPSEDDDKRHMSRLRTTSRVLKRTIRERFLKLGMLDALPERNWWNKPIFVTAEQKDERRKNRPPKEERRYGVSKEWEEKIAKQNKEEAAAIKSTLTKKGPDEAIKLLIKQIPYRADLADWNKGMLILKAAPDKFEELVTLLSKDYYDRSGYGITENAFDGMAAFYVYGRKLGAVTEKEFNEMFEKWQSNCRTYDGVRPLTKSGTVGLVGELLRDGAWEDAMKYFKVLLKTEKLTRDTVVECLVMCITSATKKLGNGVSGASAAFRGTELHADAGDVEQVEYWNSQMEMLIAANNEHGYEIAYAELAQKLHDPQSVIALTRLMALGSIRTPHQKKHILTAAYDLNTASREARWNIVTAMIEHGIPGAEAMPEVKSKETPRDVAIMFFNKLIDKEVLHKHARNYANPDNLPYLRRLLSQYQNQFNTTMQVIEKQVGAKSVLDAKNWEGIFTVLAEIGVLTPGIYAEAKACNFRKSDLKNIAERYRALKKDIFSSRPMDEQASPELVAELVCIAYQPANMSFEQVVHYCRSVKDCSSQLSQYVFPEDGYQLDLTGNKKMKLRDGQKVTTSKIIYNKPDYSRGHPSVKNPNLREVNPYLDMVRGLCKFGRFKLEEVTLSDFLVIFEDDEFIKSAFRENARAVNDDAQYRSLRLLQEALGVYLDDNLEGAIRDFLKQDKVAISNTLKSLADGLKKPGMKKTVSTQLGIAIDESKSDRSIITRVIAAVILQKFKPLKELRKKIADDLKKFVSDADEAIRPSQARLRAIISKNKASFFAKASAGICTASDTELFHRPDHFHINIIDDDKEKCVGNVQAYIMQHNGKPHLLLRGFNPSTNLLKDIDAASFCDAVIAIGEAFAEENGLAGVLLSEEQGGWHALSNRPEVTQYLEKTYGNNIVEIPPFKITGHNTISAAYMVKGTKRIRPPSHLRKRMHRDNPGESIAA